METDIFFFPPPSLCFFPPLCTSLCLSWRPTPVPWSSLSARSQWCSCPAQPHTGSGFSCYLSIPALRLWALQTGALAAGVRHPPERGAHRKGASTRQGCPPERGAHVRRVFSAGPTRVMDPGTGRFAGQQGITGLWLWVSAPCCISQVLTQLKAQHQNILQPDDKLFDLYLWVT